MMNNDEFLVVARALVAWMVALGAAERPLDFNGSASDFCTAICAVFSMFAPHYVPTKNLALPASHAALRNGRQCRTHIRRVARGLAIWFGVDTTCTQRPPLQISDSLRKRVKEVIQAVCADEADMESTHLRVALAECLFIATINAPNKQRSLEAVLTLAHDEQDALANSALVSEEASNNPPRVLVDANRENTPPNRPIDDNLKLRPAVDYKDVVFGVSCEEVKAVLEENNALRKQLAKVEEDKTAAEVKAGALEIERDSAHDQIREMRENFDAKISNDLFEQLGVHMSWQEIVSCIKNVVEAMDEMGHSAGQISGNETRTFPITEEEGNTSEANTETVQLYHPIEDDQSDDDGYEYIEVPPPAVRRPSLSTVPEDREGFESDEDDVPEPIPARLSVIEVQKPAVPVYYVPQNYGGYLLQPDMHERTNSDYASTTTGTIVSANGWEHAAQRRSVPDLLRQLQQARSTAEQHRRDADTVQRDVEEFRRDVAVLRKERDEAVKKWRELRSREAEMLREKNRSIQLLEYTLHARDGECDLLRTSASDAKAAMAKVRALEELMVTAKSDHEKLMMKQEAEIAGLREKVAAADVIANRLADAVDRTGNLKRDVQSHSVTVEHRHSAQQAWRDAQKVADDCQRALNHLVATRAVTTASVPSTQSPCCAAAERRKRRSVQVRSFCRRLLMRDGNRSRPVSMSSV